MILTGVSHFSLRKYTWNLDFPSLSFYTILDVFETFWVSGMFGCNFVAERVSKVVAFYLKLLLSHNSKIIKFI